MNTSPVPLQKKDFEKIINGEKVNLFSLQNNCGTLVEITNYGGRIVSFWTRDKKGNWEDIVLGHKDLETYLTSRELYFGAIIGRYANRIAKGTFSLQGKQYHLTVNNDGNHLHGGNKGFDKAIWKVKKYTDTSLQISYFSPDNQEGYPGNVNITTIYTLSQNNALHIEYKANTDVPTPINLTNHSYFNLKGAGNGMIYNHQLQLFSEYFLPTDKTSIPLRSVEKVFGTPMDFTSLESIGERINDNFKPLQLAKGYDHSFILNEKNIEKLAAKVYEPESGRILEVYTNQPALQFYTGNYIDDVGMGKQNKIYTSHSAFCLEAQHLPDSPNHSNFPNTILYPDQTYYWKTVYKLF